MAKSTTSTTTVRRSQIKAPKGQNNSTQPIIEVVQTRATRSSHAYRFQQPQIVCTDMSIMLPTDHLKLAWRCERGLILQSPESQGATPPGDKQWSSHASLHEASAACPNSLTPDRTLGRSRNSVARLSAITSFANCME